MKEKNKLIIAIVAVILIIVVVIGATYAYWQWSTNTAQATNVKFTVPTQDELLGATLNGGGSITVSNLAPAACTNGSYAMKKQISLSYFNQTSQTASIKATLTVNNWVQSHPGTLRLNHLHYALTTGANAGTGCDKGTIVAGGTSSSFVTSGALIDNVEIKSVPAGTGTAASPATETYYLWVWIDSTDTGSNTGSTVTDPMQDLSFTLTWTGTITNG